MSAALAHLKRVHTTFRLVCLDRALTVEMFMRMWRAGLACFDGKVFLHYYAGVHSTD